MNSVTLQLKRIERKNNENKAVMDLVKSGSFSLVDRLDYKACQKGASDVGFSVGRFRKALERVFEIIKKEESK